MHTTKITRLKFETTNAGGRNIPPVFCVFLYTTLLKTPLYKLHLYKLKYIYIFIENTLIFKPSFFHKGKQMTTIELLLIVMIFAFVCEWIDSSLGMGYGTILSPLLIILGLPILTVIPAVLISQAIGGILAGYYHHRFENTLLKRDIDGMSDDLKAVLWISVLGVSATVFASFVSTSYLSTRTLGIYTGILVLIMGIFNLIGFTFQYSHQRMILLGLVSSFLKGMSGTGFGALLTGGQLSLDRKPSHAVGVTTFTKIPICIAGFFGYWVFNGIERWDVISALIFGALLASRLGARTTKHLDELRYLKYVIAVFLIALGTLTILKIKGIL